MTTRDLSKLQVRAEVLAVVQQLSALDETSRESQIKQVRRLKNISNIDYVLECLLRELPKVSYDQKQIIAQLLLEFGNLDKLSKPLWALIKDPNINDELKDTANVILRNLGDPSDPDLYLSYLKDPQELIDKETERMLRMASLNPEAQIDFLDFLFSLPPPEQVNLINSLKNDYPGEYLTCIFVPALEARPNEEVVNVLIDALGNTRSPKALSYLEELFSLPQNDLKKKILKKNINLLKLSGAQKASSDDFYNDLFSESKLFNCYVSPIDGIGNQGIIMSRLKSNDDISLFSVVINDMQGVMDCFGFNQITKTDFERIITKFQEGTPRVNIPASYCKNRISNAETLNKAINMPIPYEYSSWKILALDAEDFDEDIITIVEELKEDSLIEEIDKIYDIPEFYCWFIEDDDHPHILNFFEDSLSYFTENINNFTESVQELCDYLDSQIQNDIDKIFDDSWRDLYFHRLANETYLLKHYDLNNEAKLAATTAWTLASKDLPLNKNKFLIKLLRKSLAECFLRFQYKIDDNFDPAKCSISQNQLSSYKKILDEIFVIWQVDF